MAAPFTNIQFEPDYDVYKMRALLDDLERQFSLGQAQFTGVSGDITALELRVTINEAILADHEIRIAILEAQDESDSFLEWGM